ncbi:DNA methyltransferase [Streptomonospora nanhaiensis]|uniref:DNA methyltransferase n=1 Tax=Streptomonospora nanhaiensis TaxID=1323731 RepID=UPI001C9A0F63|nr:DNA methyltransferase [Streptomonospora nanhaiensis]MBX9387424.1 site-specific DNA-methyltransferase [Streptomonospora nanhaiensis]
MGVEEIFSAVRKREFDRSFIGQADLDVLVRERRSALPWRGQFTPGLVSKLLDVYYPGSGIVVDPFLGSGTTVLECIRKGIPSAGVEINPAALELSGILELASLPHDQRLRIVEEASAYLDKVSVAGQDTLFGGSEDIEDFVEYLLDGHRSAVDKNIERVFSTTLLLSMGDKKETDVRKVKKSWSQVRDLIADFPSVTVPSQVIAGDARRIPLDDGCAGLVVTSPPYINVFNYHQNYRPAVERIGWDVLPAARTEIGSNRKNRQNRFLTVIQYCVDMMQALREMERLVFEAGNVVLVVGRESKVRGVAFSNSEIVASLAEGLPNLRFARWQERKFTNRFGAVIYEDILSYEVDKNSAVFFGSELDKFSREVARHVLGEALEQSTDDVREDLQSAAESVTKVEASPELSLTKI